MTCASASAADRPVTDEPVARRKCRWCRFNVAAGFAGAAVLWRHAREKHRREVETCDWPDHTPKGA
jgi:hypothetical protein